MIGGGFPFTIESFFPIGCGPSLAPLPVPDCCSNSFTNEVVGAIEVSSVESSIIRNVPLVALRSSPISTSFSLFRRRLFAVILVPLSISLSSVPLTSQLSTERSGDGSRERDATAELAARKENDGAGETLSRGTGDELSDAADLSVSNISARLSL
jgi:hypothetical protein